MRITMLIAIVLCLLLLLAACLQPAPMSSGFIPTVDDEGLNLIDVYVGLDAPLNRAPNNEQFAVPPYFGVCTVTIPRQHQLGKLETPLLKRFANRHRHVLLNSVELQSKAAWKARLTEERERTQGSRILVLFYGHGVTRKDACRRAAQIKYDTGYRGPVVLVSWSVGTDLAYSKTREAVGWAAPYAHTILETVCSITQPHELDVIAHSAGALLFLRSMPITSLCFHDVVLAAPDIAEREFLRDWREILVRNSRRVIVFYSPNDRALNASGGLTGSIRLGAGPVASLGPVFTIDSSSAATEVFGFRHSYVSNNREVLSILHDLIVDGHSLKAVYLLSALPNGSSTDFQIRR